MALDEHTTCNWMSHSCADEGFTHIRTLEAHRRLLKIRVFGDAVAPIDPSKRIGRVNCREAVAAHPKGYPPRCAADIIIAAADITGVAGIGVAE